MKRILFILFLVISFQSFGQNRFPSIDSLQNYILRYFRNSTVETFTNLRGQNIVYGLSEMIDSLAGNGAVDSIWLTGGTPDTLRYRKTGTTYTVGTIQGGSSTDTTSLSNRINGKVDSVTISTDSLFYHVNGTGYYVGNIADASAGGDTTIFEVVLDSTGQQNQRVLFSKNRKIASDSRFLFDDTNDKLVINGANVSVGGPNTKLWVGGNTNITGTATIGNVATSTDTTTYKPAILGADGVLRKLTYWPVGSGGGIPADTSLSINNRINTKQDLLVSGTNIKTLNSVSLLGSGNIAINTNGRVFYTSQWGLVSDADISYGSSTFGTNNTAAMQALLDSAVNGPIIIVVDGKYSATQLKVRSNTTLMFVDGAGFIQRDASNVSFIVNYNRSTSIIDSNITIIGGTINQNGYRSGSFRQNKTGPDGWNHAMRFAGVKDLKLENLKIFSSRNFAVYVTRFQDLDIRDIQIRNNQQDNQDGIKIQVGQTAYVSNIVGYNMGDDVLSIVSNDIFHPTTPLPSCAAQTDIDSFAVYGLVQDVYVKNLTINNTNTGGVRIMSRSELMDNIVLDGVFINGKGQILIDNYSEGPSCLYSSGIGGGNFGKIIIKNVIINSDIYSYKDAAIYVNAYVRELVFDGIRRTTSDANSDPLILFDVYSNVKKLSLNDIQLTKKTAAAQPQINVKGSVLSWSVNRVNYFDSLYTQSPFIAIDTASIVNNVAMNNVIVKGAKSIMRARNDSIANLTLTNITHLNCDSTYGSFFAKGKIADAVADGYFGIKAFGDSGTIIHKRGTYALNLNEYDNFCSIDTLHKSLFTASNGTAITSYTPDIGNAWQNTQGTWVINTNSAVTSATATSNNWVTTTSVTPANYTVIMTVQRTSSTALPQIWLRTTSAADGVVCNITPSGTVGGLYNAVGGSYTAFGTSIANTNLNLGNEFVVKATIQGQVVTIYIDDVFYTRGTIPTVQSGTRVGFGTYNSGTTGGILFKDFYVIE